jgi:hypothetical protein
LQEIASCKKRFFGGILQKHINLEEIRQLMFGHGPLTEAELTDAAQAAERVQEWEEKRLELLKKAREQRHALKNRMNMQNMVAVHLTNYFPKNGVIKTTADFVVNQDGVDVRFPRHSIHFALNGPVGSHMMGSWDGRKYAIIIPLNKIAKRIVTLNPVDTWLIGQLSLPRGSVIIAHQEDLKRKNPGNARIIPVEGDIHQAVREFIKKQGLPVASIGGWGWNFEAENKELASRLIMGGLNPLNAFDGGKFNEFSERLGYQTGFHTHSFFSAIEGLLTSISLILPKFYDKSESQGGSSVKDIENQIQNANGLLDQLNEFTSKREKQGFSTSEKISLDKIKKSLEHCITELKLYFHKVRRVEDNFGKKVERVEDLSDTEKEWLIRESLIVKKLKDAIGKHDEDEIKSLMKRIGRVERRAYRKYEQLKERLNELSHDPNFPIDIGDLHQELDVYEAYLAKFLSFGSGMIQEEAGKGNWDKVSQYITHLEEYLIRAEDMLKTMHEVLESRYKKYKEEF